MKIAADMRGVTPSCASTTVISVRAEFPAQLIDQVPHVSWLCFETLLKLWISLAACVESLSKIVLLGVMMSAINGVPNSPRFRCSSVTYQGSIVCSVPDDSKEKTLWCRL